MKKVFEKVLAVALAGGIVYLLINLYKFSDRTLNSLTVRDIVQILTDPIIIVLLWRWMRESWTGTGL